MLFSLCIQSDAFKSHMGYNENEVRKIDHLHFLFFKFFICLVSNVPFRFDMVNLVTLVAQMVLVEYFIALVCDTRVQPLAEILHFVQATLVQTQIEQIEFSQQHE